MILSEQQMAYTLPKRAVKMTVSTLLFSQICKRMNLKQRYINAFRRVHNTY